MPLQQFLELARLARARQGKGFRYPLLWYGVEFYGDDLFFVLVVGFERELGYFRLSELLQNRGKRGLPIERDLYFTPTPVSQLGYAR